MLGKYIVLITWFTFVFYIIIKETTEIRTSLKEKYKIFYRYASQNMKYRKNITWHQLMKYDDVLLR